MSKKILMSFIAGLGGIGEDVRGMEVLAKDFDLNKLTGEEFDGGEEEGQDAAKHRYVDSDEDLGEIDMDPADNKFGAKRAKNQRKDKEFETDAFKQIAQDEEDYEDYEDAEATKKEQMEEEEEEEAAEVRAASARKRPTRRPIPSDLNIGTVLETLVESRTDTIYKFSELFYPEHKIVYDMLQAYSYKHFIRNPDEFLQKFEKKYTQYEEKQKEVLNMYYQMAKYQEEERQQRLTSKWQHEEQRAMQAATAKVSFDFNVKKEQFEDPFQEKDRSAKHPKMNSTEWFQDLKHHLLKHMRPLLNRSTQEIEEEVKIDSTKKTQAPTHHPDQSSSNFLKKSLALGSSNRYNKGPPSRRGTVDFASGMQSHAETPSRDLHSLLENMDSVTRNHQDEMDEETMNFGESIIDRPKTLENTANPREYMDQFQEEDLKFLSDFNPSLAKSKLEAQQSQAFEQEGARPAQNAKELQYYDEGYIKIPFRSDLGTRIFDYEEENIAQDLLAAGAAAAGESAPGGAVYKKLKLDKRISRINISADNLDLTYCNNHLLNASWKDFFKKDTEPSKDLEQEYSNVVIDLNDRNLFYNKINPVIYGMQKYQPRRAAQEMALLEAKAGPQVSGKGDNMSQISATMLKTGDGSHNLGDLDSTSVLGTHKSQSISNFKKQLRIDLVKLGKDPDKISNIEEMVDLLAKKKVGQHGSDKQDDTVLKSILKFENDLRRKKRRLVPIQDSRVAEDFEFNEFLIKDSDFLDFHRPDLNRNRYRQGHSWRVEIVKSNRDRKKESTSDSNNEKINSFEHFKNQRRLSLREGTFSLFEFIEETPLIIPNAGMGCKISRYVYPKRIVSKLRQKEQIKEEQSQTEIQTTKSPEEKPEEKNEEKSREEFFDYINESLGDNGLIQFVHDGSQEHPLMANITNEKYVGFSVLENNLYVAPLFPQKPTHRDFVLVRHVNSEGYTMFFLRKIESLYSVGQIEPKREVFTPQSRALREFFRKCLQFIIKNKFNKNEAVDLRDLSKIFPTYNEHNLRKQIRDFGGEQDPKDNKRFFFNKDRVDSDREDDAERTEGTMKPDDACLYERMHASRIRLKNLGLEELKSCDKINTVKSRFMKKIKEDSNLTPGQKARKCLLARYIAEELQLTAWNLSQSFSDAKQKKGRLYLTGFGDPTGGHGGYSYVKFPMKTSRYDKDDKKNKDNEKANMITGTDADLRSLENKTMETLILKYKQVNPELLSKLHRWDKKNMLTDIAKEHPDDPELKKYVRVNRITTKEQKQKYQKEINKLFMSLIDNLSKQRAEEFPSDDEWELEYDVDKEAEREFEASKAEEKVEDNSSDGDDDDNHD